MTHSLATSRDEEPAGSAFVWGLGLHARNDEFLHASRVTRPRIWTGLLLNESYRVGSLIEQGATTELYDGTEISTGEPVALKILLPQIASDANTRTLFLEEARVLTRLSQPGLHRYRSCARDPQSDLTYIVTEMIGARLSARLGARKLSQQDIIDFTKRIALALGAAHRAGLVHRNLCPHAIAFPDGRLIDAVVTDFNLIKAAHSGRNRDINAAMLDRAFCAPEQLNGAGAADAIGPWTDIYSLGRVVLAAIGAKSNAETSPDLSLLPRKLQPVFERMLESKPARRPQSMDDVVRQLDLAAGSAPLRNLMERAPSISLPRFRGAANQTPPAKADQAVAAPSPEKPVALPGRKPLPPLPASLLPAKKAPLATFHEARTSAGRLGVAGRAAVAFTALLLAASPWIIQTSLPGAPADASTVAPAAPVLSAKAQAENRARRAARAFEALPKGQLYGSTNTYSRVTLRVHRPTRVIVHARGTRLLLNRMLQPGDSYRTPSLEDLTVTTEDAGAVEVVFNGTPVGFVGQDGAPVDLAPLSRFASLAPPSPGEASPETAIATTIAEPALTSEQTEAIARGIAAIEDAASETPPAQAAEQATATSEPPETPLILQGAAAPLRSEPERTIETQIPPRAAEMRDIPLPPVAVSIPAHPVPQQVVVPPAEPEVAERRPLMQRLMPWRRGQAPEPAPVTLSKEGADRAKAASDMAKGVRETAQQKAARESRAREGAFFNTTLGIASPY